MFRKILVLMLGAILLLSGCKHTGEVLDNIAKGNTIGALKASAGLGQSEDVNYSSGEIVSASEYKNHQIQSYVNSLLSRSLAKVKQVHGKQLKIKKVVIADKSVVQGVSSISPFKGALIHISRGMLNIMQNEAELVALINHEIAHNYLNHLGISGYAKDQAKYHGLSTAAGKAIDSVSQGHIGQIAKTYANNMSASLISKKKEKDADLFAIDLTIKMGYDPYAFADLFYRLDKAAKRNIAQSFVQKVKGSHISLKGRGKYIEDYIEDKGIERGYGKKRIKSFTEGMGSGSDFDITLVSSALQKDLRSLDRIKQDLKGKQQIDLSEFLDKMQILSQLVKKHGITEEDYLYTKYNPRGRYFMQERILISAPLWFDAEALTRIKDSIMENLETLGQIGVSFIPFVGDSIDIYEFASGKDFYEGGNLSKDDRMLSGAGIIWGSGRAYREGADLLADSLRKAGNENAAKLADKLADSPEFARVHDVMQRLPGGLKVERIRKGTDPDKVVIIGRKMDGVVNDAAAHMKKGEVKIETFKPSGKARDEYTQFLVDNKRQPTYKEQQSMLTYKENIEWAKKAKKEGYTVLDMGNPTKIQEASPFYDIEKKIFF